MKLRFAENKVVNSYATNEFSRFLLITLTVLSGTIHVYPPCLNGMARLSRNTAELWNLCLLPGDVMCVAELPYTIE